MPWSDNRRLVMGKPLGRISGRDDGHHSHQGARHPVLREVLNQRHLAALDELLAPSFVSRLAA
jgi:hypothetical protein